MTLSPTATYRTTRCVYCSGAASDLGVGNVDDDGARGGRGGGKGQRADLYTAPFRQPSHIQSPIEMSRGLTSFSEFFPAAESHLPQVAVLGQALSGPLSCAPSETLTSVLCLFLNTMSTAPQTAPEAVRSTITKTCSIRMTTSCPFGGFSCFGIRRSEALQA